jgi:adenylate cyclase
VGRELGVRHVLEGSVRKAGSRVRITGQLIDATSGAHLWADRFKGAVEDVFELQDQVTEKVVAALAPRLEQAEIDRAKRKTIGNPGAYDCYLRSLACLQTLSKQNVEEAMALLRHAIDLDPELAPAYGLLLFCYAAGKGFAAVRNLDEDNAEVARLVRIAVRIADDDAVALGNTAWAIAYVLQDLSHAKSLVDRAVALNPNLARAWGFSGWINLWSGNPAVAAEHLARAVRHDPLHSMNIWSAMAHACFFLDRYSESMTWAERGLRESPDAHPSLRIFAASAAFAGMTESARKAGVRLCAVDPMFRVSRLGSYLGPYRNREFVEKYAEGLRLAGLPE